MKIAKVYCPQFPHVNVPNHFACHVKSSPFSISITFHFHLLPPDRIIIPTPQSILPYSPPLFIPFSIAKCLHWSRGRIEKEGAERKGRGIAEGNGKENGPMENGPPPLLPISVISCDFGRPTESSIPPNKAIEGEGIGRIESVGEGIVHPRGTIQSPLPLNNPQIDCPCLPSPFLIPQFTPPPIPFHRPPLRIIVRASLFPPPNSRMLFSGAMADHFHTFIHSPSPSSSPKCHFYCVTIYYCRPICPVDFIVLLYKSRK